MKYKVSRRTILGTLIVALAFSDTIRNATSWVYPFIMLSLLVGLYFLNLASGQGVKRAKYIFKKYMKIGVLPYVIIFLYAVLVISINQQGSRFISRSLGSTLIAIMTIVTSAALVYIFKKKAPDVLCYGLILNYIVHIVLNFEKIGFSGLIEHFVNPLNTYQNVFELHSVGFTLNLLLIYYIVKKDRNDKGKIISIITVLYLIMKRIAFVGSILALFTWFITDVLLRKKGTKKYMFIMWGLAIAALVYVGFICLYPELFKGLMIKLGILNRYIMTTSFSNYYSFDVRFLGRGFGFVSVLIPEMDIAGGRVEALHNDILKDFIEEGFIGFCIIYYYLFVKVPQMVTEGKNKRCYACVTMMLIYTFVTLMTDNVLEYVSYTCTWFVIYGTIHLYGNELFPLKQVQPSQVVSQLKLNRSIL